MVGTVQHWKGFLMLSWALPLEVFIRRLGSHLCLGKLFERSCAYPLVVTMTKDAILTDSLFMVIMELLTAVIAPLQNNGTNKTMTVKNVYSLGTLQDLYTGNRNKTKRSNRNTPSVHFLSRNHTQRSNGML